MSRDLNGKKQPVMGRKEDMEKEHSRQREQPVERPWGRTWLVSCRNSKEAHVARAEQARGREGGSRIRRGRRGGLSTALQVPGVRCGGGGEVGMGKGKQFAF